MKARGEQGGARKGAKVFCGGTASNGELAPSHGNPACEREKPMVAACDMGMSPVMRAEGERRKSLWPKLSGGSGSGRGVESGDRGEADGMTTDRSSLSVRSVFMYMLRGETSRGECKDINTTCSVSKRDPFRFHLGDRTRWRTQSACVNLASSHVQVRPDTPFRNCKQHRRLGAGWRSGAARGGVGRTPGDETRDNPVFSPKKQDGRFARLGSGNPIVVTRTHILIFTHT